MTSDRSPHPPNDDRNNTPVGHNTWPEAPNLYSAVTSTLPALCGILAAFFSGYFAAVYVSDTKSLTQLYIISPLIFSDHWQFTLLITRKIAISLVCVAGILMMFSSISQAMIAQILYYDKDNYEDASAVDDEMLLRWKQDRLFAISKCLFIYHLSLPTLALSLALLMDGAILAALFYLIIYSYYKLFRDAHREDPAIMKSILGSMMPAPLKSLLSWVKPKSSTSV